MLPALRPAVLLVDDDPTLLSVLARRLTREGFDVRTAASGQMALAALDRSWPALVVVDVMMPGMDGFELCRRIKRIADLPIIVLSAVDAGEASESCGGPAEAGARSTWTAASSRSTSSIARSRTAWAASR